jgi:hypothetical protein
MVDPMPPNTNATQQPDRLVYGLARELARPVARGWLTRSEADVALINCALRRCGKSDAIGVARLAQHSLRQWLRPEEDRRLLARHRIDRTLHPMIARRTPSNHLLAEAHGVNGEMGFPLTEAETTAAVEDQVYWALEPAPSKPHHVW